MGMVPGIGFMPATGAVCGTPGVVPAATGTPIGRGATGTDNEDCVDRCKVVDEAAGAIGAWRLEFSDMKVARPSTSAIAAPAARPTLSRRVFWVATIG
jgi:hypothetical protein